MPESAALFFFTGAFYFFVWWYDEEKDYLLFLSSIFTSLSITQKIPTAFIGLAMILLLLKNMDLSFWQNGNYGLLPLLL